MIKPLDLASDDEEEDMSSIPLPRSRGKGAVDSEVVSDHTFKAHVEDEPDDDVDTELETQSSMEVDTTTPQSASLVTLSSVPKSRWANLSNLEDIKRRNKPTEPPKAPKAAPFFLPMKEGLQSEFAFADDETPELGPDGSRVLNFGKIGVVSPFQKALIRAGENEEFSEFGDTLKEMTPAQIDLEVRSLQVDDDLTQLKHFLTFLAHQLKGKRDFELTQAYLHLFLKVHGDVLRGSEEMSAVLRSTLDEHEICWVHLEGLFQHAICTASFLKGQV